MHYYYIHTNSAGCTFVKEAGYFIKQQGHKRRWGKGWYRVRAHSIEHAREIGDIRRWTKR